MNDQTQKGNSRKLWKWILGILAGLTVLTVGAYVTVFYINQFSLQVQMEGEPEPYVEYGQKYQDSGATVMLYGSLLWKDGIVPENVILHTDNGVQEDKLGKYPVTYYAEWSWGKKSWVSDPVQRTVRVVDSESPVITLIRSDEPLMAGTPYEEEGFIALDNYDGDITHRVIRDESYGLVTYTVLDSSGNPAYIEREIPYYDPLPPEISLNEGNYIAIPTGTIFQDPGFTATDNVNGDMTELVEVEGEVLWYEPGLYELTYSVTDGFDNNTTVIRQVEVQAVPWPEIHTPQGKVIYLTFDDGPGPYTLALLDVLDKYDVKATFFVTDSGYDSVMKKIVKQGHSIGIHSVSHDYYSIYASPEAYFTDLNTMQQIIYDNTGVMTTLMRFPGGSSNMVSRYNKGIMTMLSKAVQDAGFQFFDWNVDSMDAGGAKSSKKVLENVIAGVQEQRVSIVLQHDIHDYSVEAVEDIILWGLENGYRFLPLNMNSPNSHHEVNN